LQKPGRLAPRGVYSRLDFVMPGLTDFVMPGLTDFVMPGRRPGHPRLSFFGRGKDLDGRAFAAPKALRPRRRDRPGHDEVSSDHG
jgi:hypothetical protein